MRHLISALLVFVSVSVLYMLCAGRRSAFARFAVLVLQVAAERVSRVLPW